MTNDCLQAEELRKDDFVRMAHHQLLKAVEIGNDEYTVLHCDHIFLY